jgi:hypothetical protein
MRKRERRGGSERHCNGWAEGQEEFIFYFEGSQAMPFVPPVTMKNVDFWDIRTPVRTSQETHYVSVTEPRQLMLCKILGFHGGDYEEFRLLRSYAVALVRTDVSEEPSVSNIMAIRISELGTTSAVTSNQRTLRNSR